MLNTSQKSLGKLGLYLLLPLLFFLIPTSWLEAHPPICLSRLLFGKTCPGCGMTRATSCAIHGQFRKAFSYNKRVVIVLPLLAFIWSQNIFKEYKRFTTT